MKNHDLILIQATEVLQILTLNSLFNEQESDKLIFQGGTSLRWMHNANRFSEGLDFITTLPAEKIRQIIPAMLHRMQVNLRLTRRSAKSDFTIKEKDHMVKAMLRQGRGRNVIRLKIEFYLIPSLDMVKTMTSFLGNMPMVRACVIQNQLPQPNALVIHETPESILADKIIAILKRPYIKGRDFWDMWFLQRGMGITLDADILRNHLSLYPAPDIRSPVYLPGHGGWPDREDILRAIEIDLQRFITPRELNWWRSREFKELVESVSEILAESKHVLAETKTNRNNGTSSVPSPSF